MRGEYQAQYLVEGDHIVLNRHTYEVMYVEKGIGVVHLKVRSTRSTKIRDAVFQSSEFVKVSKQSPLIKS